jgi:phage baseplate assembly protein W
MADVSHQWGSDLALGPTGDVASASRQLLGQQRVLRRLLTNPGEYIWQLDYGAGLARFIGRPVNPQQISAVVRSQIFKEAAVARQPEPVINVQISPGGAAGTVYVYIRYVDADSGQTQVLSFSVAA